MRDQHLVSLKAAVLLTGTDTVVFLIMQLMKSFMCSNVPATAGSLSKYSVNQLSECSVRISNSIGLLQSLALFIILTPLSVFDDLLENFSVFLALSQ